MSCFISDRKYINVWTAQEKQIFKEKYLQHPKNFGLIASFLEKKVWLAFEIGFVLESMLTVK